MTALQITSRALSYWAEHHPDASFEEAMEAVRIHIVKALPLLMEAATTPRLQQVPKKYKQTSDSTESDQPVRN